MGRTHNPNSFKPSYLYLTWMEVSFNKTISDQDREYLQGGMKRTSLAAWLHYYMVLKCLSLAVHMVSRLIPYLEILNIKYQQRNNIILFVHNHFVLPCFLAIHRTVMCPNLDVIDDNFLRVNSWDCTYSSPRGEQLILRCNIF